MNKAEIRDIENFLSEKDIQDIINLRKPGSHLVDYHLKSAEGLAGFVSEYHRLTLNVRDGNSAASISLFIKALPILNKAKVEFVIENKAFKKENLMYQLFDEIQESEDLKPWHTKAYKIRENHIVMPDLVIEGYKTHPIEQTFDINHVLISMSSIARFHASFSVFFNKKSTPNPYCFLSEYGEIIEDLHYRDSPFVRAGAKLTNNFLKEFSSKWTQYPKKLLEQLEKLYITGCCSLKDYEETLNVVVHRDLWVNNILFKYEGDIPTNAVLIDFQCICYAPPAFDLMMFLYLNTSRPFRERHENDVLNHYFTIFTENLNNETKSTLTDYNREEFLRWCDKARLFGIVGAAILLPTVLIDTIASSKYFDDPDTFLEYFNVDRSYPVITNAKKNNSYKNRILNLFEEVVDEYILKRQFTNV